MKMNGLGCWFVELTVTNRAWAPVLNSIQATHGRVPMDPGRVTLYQDKPFSHCLLHSEMSSVPYTARLILRPGAFTVLQWRKNKLNKLLPFLELQITDTMQ